MLDTNDDGVITKNEYRDVLRNILDFSELLPQLAKKQGIDTFTSVAELIDQVKYSKDFLTNINICKILASIRVPHLE